MSVQLSVSLAVVLLGWASFTGHALATPAEFDYFILVRQWPGAYCSSHSCPLLHRHGYHFTIHGLWPNYNSGAWPQFCDPTYKFDEDQINDLLPQLEEEWPSYMSADDTFWEHEWTKHGTCAMNVLGNEHRYFKTVLQLHYRNDLSAALERAEIIPSENKVYSKLAIEDAVSTMWGARPIVHCEEGKLSEIWMCFDKNLQAFDCTPAPANPGASACTEVSIPPLAYYVDEDQPDLAGLDASLMSLQAQQVSEAGVYVSDAQEWAQLSSSQPSASAGDTEPFEEQVDVQYQSQDAFEDYEGDVYTLEGYEDEEYEAEAGPDVTYYEVVSFEQDDLQSDADVSEFVKFFDDLEDEEQFSQELIAADMTEEEGVREDVQFEQLAEVEEGQDAYDSEDAGPLPLLEDSSDAVLVDALPLGPSPAMRCHCYAIGALAAICCALMLVRASAHLARRMAASQPAALPITDPESLLSPLLADHTLSYGKGTAPIY